MPISVLKNRTICIPETCEIWLGLVNSCVYFARQTHKIYRVLPYSVDLGSFEIHCVKQYLENVVLFGRKYLCTPEMNVKLETNLYVGPVNISLIVDTAIWQYEIEPITRKHSWDNLWAPTWI